MDKALLFIYDDMADFEVTFLTHLLGADAGMEIELIAFENRLIKSKAGVSYMPDKTVKDTKPEDAKVLIIPGGWNKEVREELIVLIQEMHKQNKLLAAICAGPRFLAKAGILDKVKYTTSADKWTDEHRTRFDEEDPFPRQNYVGGRVCRDGNVITAEGVAFVDFAIEACDWLGLFEDADDRAYFEKLIKG